jgi:hypothetical protein
VSKNSRNQAASSHSGEHPVEHTPAEHFVINVQERISSPDAAKELQRASEALADGELFRTRFERHFIEVMRRAANRARGDGLEQLARMCEYCADVASSDAD